MASTSDSRQPYRLSNLLLVTESLTLMARNSSVPFGAHLLQAVHAGGRLLGDADDLGALARVPGRVVGELGLDRGVEAGLLLAGRLGEHRRVLLGALAEVHQQRGVAAVVEDHVRAFALRRPWRRTRRCGGCSPSSRPASRPCRRTPACRCVGQRGGGVVLGREDVARGPAHVGAERLQRLDQHGGLDRHVQRAGDARALERLAFANSSRMAIRPGISVSAILISLRPQSARDRSATM